MATRFQVATHLSLCALLILAGSAAEAEVPPSPSLIETLDSSPTELFSDPATNSESQVQTLLKRLDQVEQANRTLHERIQQLENRHAENASIASGSRNSTSPMSQREAAGVEAEGTSGRTFVREFDSKPSKWPAKTIFADGLEFASEDGQFRLTFHDLTQVDFRGFPDSGSGNLHDQFFLPRQRWYFTGQATKSVEFYTAINRGYGSLDLLDAFITLNVLDALNDKTIVEDGTPSGAQGTDARVAPDKGFGNPAALRFRMGRMKTPYLYEYFAISEGDLIAPERSLYATNLAGNRKDGAMILGELFDESVSYALGVFNGQRRSFGDTNDSKDVYLYLNTRPFLKSESLSFLNYFNIGGSLNGGNERSPTQPNIFVTANDQTSESNDTVVQSLSPTFLAFKNNVTELGRREQWAANIDYYYKSFTLLTEYAGGFGNYSTNGATSTRLPYDGYMVQGAYFLTGEQMTRRVNVVRPLRRFGKENGTFGLGAIELHARYSELHLGEQVFTAGLADPSLWANRAKAVDIGVNWYWNYYTKIMLDYQRADFNQPVTTGSPGHFTDSTNLLWLRLQLFF